MMKKLFAIFLLCLVMAGCMTAAYGADDSRSYRFDLTVDGRDTCRAATGDIITVTFHLRRTDSDADAPMYAMQNEITYDSAFFAPVEGGVLLSDTIRTAQVTGESGAEKLYMNFLSTTGGQMWSADRLVGSFQLRVVGTAGSSTITSENYLVSTADGRDTYQAAAQDVTVTVTETAPQSAAHGPSGTLGAGWGGFALGIGALLVAALMIRYLKRKIFPRHNP